MGGHSLPGTLQWIVSLLSKAPIETIHWRVPGDECPPTPQEGEVVIFADHLAQGFKPPGSKFYRDVLATFQLRPHDIGPNSVSNICHFQVFCEAYLQEEPTVELFRDFFYLNRRTEFTDGPNTELGGMADVGHRVWADVLRVELKAGKHVSEIF